MNDRTDDELDRLLAALPLEEPPADLRASILAATVQHVPAEPVDPWEASAWGVLLALALWFVTHGSAFGGGVALLERGAFALAQPATLLWLTVGLAVAFALSAAPDFSAGFNLARKGH
ncbi:MAG: hypothetical protein HKL92_05705 [Candidatus Eremiobacteraeota bacterium]|uniref:Uncharacterized protein n=1 Tax=mine drainage metagenome TaxID=410659 RepID=E6Q3G6_9ZZZZ|nr:hypothetical protein [Candidatus Eremiobacteraeota bacterium]NNM92820.1 hypothetical protein [Candidatus Eremiobacteraeota bacterium]